MIKKCGTLFVISTIVFWGACSDESSGDPDADGTIDGATGNNNPDPSTGTGSGTGSETDPDPTVEEVDINCNRGPVPDPLEIAGMVEDIVGGNPARGVLLEVFAPGSQTSLSSSTSDPNGNYSLSIPTNGQPFVGKIEATSEDFIDMQVYPSGLPENASDLNIPALTPQARQLASTLAGITLNDDDALLIGFIFDCNNQGLEGATMTANLDSGDFLYLTDEAPFVEADRSYTATSGVGVVLNAVAGSSSPGMANVSASYFGRTWNVDVDVIPGEVSIALFVP